MEAWARAGVRLLHWTGYQWVSGPHVPLAGLRRGDLVFYAFNIADPATIHHVGIYIGHGLMVDAPYTGVVRPHRKHLRLPRLDRRDPPRRLRAVTSHVGYRVFAKWLAANGGWQCVLRVT